MKKSKEEYRIVIKVKANSKKNCILLKNGEVIVNVKKPAIKGEANKELIKLFKEMGIKARIEKGFSSSMKRIIIDKKREDFIKMLENEK